MGAGFVGGYNRAACNLLCDYHVQCRGGLTMRCSGRRASSRRLQGLHMANAGLGQQAARRLRAAADRGR